MGTIYTPDSLIKEDILDKKFSKGIRRFKPSSAGLCLYDLICSVGVTEVVASESVKFGLSNLEAVPDTTMNENLVSQKK